ncbi:MAG TPA: aminoglycoside phosphotransferase family protein [Daejeonella sp.]
MLTEILEGFGLHRGNFEAKKINSGLINSTWKLTGEENELVLQMINSNVFTSPELIMGNIESISSFLKIHHPDYFFVRMMPALNGSYLLKSSTGDSYRLMPFVKGSTTLEVVGTRNEAFQAAKQFGKFTANLSGFDINSLSYPLPDFHNLTLRFQQFREASESADKNLLSKAESIVNQAYSLQEIAEIYASIVKDNLIPLRVIHHDTKISNVLFNSRNEGLCVIDLDTAMPGYFFSDLGDMLRTYLSPVNEEEKDFSKIEIRIPFFEAILEGYLSEMGAVLTPDEEKLFIYAGKFMIYMQGLRFLTDYLNGDIYYQTTYKEQNLIRAQNQFVLLSRYLEAEKQLTTIVANLAEAKNLN